LLKRSTRNDAPKHEAKEVLEDLNSRHHDEESRLVIEEFAKWRSESEKEKLESNLKA
jgi:hypothetical protein